MTRDSLSQPQHKPLKLGQGVTLTAEDILDGEPECFEYLNMLRSRRLSLGVGSSISAPDLLKLNAVREQGGSAILAIGNDGVAKTEPGVALGLNSAETEEYNRAAMVIQRGYKARIARRKLSGISEKGNREMDVTSPVSFDSGIIQNADRSVFSMSSRKPTKL